MGSIHLRYGKMDYFLLNCLFLQTVLRDLLWHITEKTKATSILGMMLSLTIVIKPKYTIRITISQCLNKMETSISLWRHTTHKSIHMASHVCIIGGSNSPCWQSIKLKVNLSYRKTIITSYLGKPTSTRNKAPIIFSLQSVAMSLATNSWSKWRSTGLRPIWTLEISPFSCILKWI